MMRHLILLLVVAAACYGGVTWVYRQIDDRFAGDTPSVSAADSRAAGRQARPGTALPGAVDTDLITRRNIFLAPDGADRPGSGADPFSPLGQAEPDLLLVGTVVHSDGGHRAIIYQVEQEKQILVKEGDVIDGVSIKEILSGKALVSRRGRSEVLDMTTASELRRARRALETPAIQPPAAADPEEEPVEPAEADEAGEAGEADEGAPPALQVDPENLGDISEGTIIKGRISE